MCANPAGAFFFGKKVTVIFFKAKFWYFNDFSSKQARCRWVPTPQGLFFRQKKRPLYFLKPYFDILMIFHQNHWFYENKKEFWRNCGHFGGSSASVSLLCVRIERIWLLSNYLIFGDGGDDGDGDGDGDGGRISGRAQAPIPSHPGITYPVRAPPLTPTRGVLEGSRSRLVLSACQNNKFMK